MTLGSPLTIRSEELSLPPRPSPAPESPAQNPVKPPEDGLSEPLIPVATRSDLLRYVVTARRSLESPRSPPPHLITRPHVPGAPGREMISKEQQDSNSEGFAVPLEVTPTLSKGEQNPEDKREFFGPIASTSGRLQFAEIETEIRRKSKKNMGKRRRNSLQAEKVAEASKRKGKKRRNRGHKHDIAIERQKEGSSR